MNSLTNYWLCRAPGSATEGPFTLGQLRAMYATGAIHAQALICEHGGQEWAEARWMLDAEAEQVPEQETAYIRSRQVKKGGSGCAAAILFLVGLVLLFSVWPLGLIVIAFAVVLDQKPGHEWFCGGCGNSVVVTSNQCPNCRVILLDIPKMPWSIRLKRLGKSFLWALLILAVVCGIVYFFKSLYQQ